MPIPKTLRNPINVYSRPNVITLPRIIIILPKVIPSSIPPEDPMNPINVYPRSKVINIFHAYPKTLKNSINVSTTHYLRARWNKAAKPPAPIRGGGLPAGRSEAEAARPRTYPYFLYLPRNIFSKFDELQTNN